MILQNSDYNQIYNVDLIEAQRLIEQARLDASKSAIERNRLGQYATPSPLALEIIDYSKSLFSANEKIRFLDPAIGTGSFYSALLKIFPLEQIENAVGYEIDPDYARIAIQLWSNTSLELNIANFTESNVGKWEELKFNFLICNPPYVRHHHLSSNQKKILRELGLKITGIQLSGLAGLYGYFLLIAHKWMSQDGLACWLIPSEFMDVNYGKKIKEYLLNKVTLLRIHRFAPEDLQFDGVLVSTSIIWFKNTKPIDKHFIEFTAGESIRHPSVSNTIPLQSLKEISKWSGAVVSNSQKAQVKSRIKLSDLFDIKRGVATGANHFFILTLEQVDQLSIPLTTLTPILPSPRYLPEDEIFSDEQGNPRCEPKLFLLDCKLQPEELQINYPSVWNYLQRGIDAGIPERYLCSHRSLWYRQEIRSPAPFLCTYMGRNQSKNGKPFRFILNHSIAIAPNVYLMMYPKQNLTNFITAKPQNTQLIWQALNSISMQSLIDEGRVYGDGLHKLEPRELANAPADVLLEILESHSQI